MPEGHTIHRLARAHTKALRGQTIRARSPQAPPPALRAAQAIDGRVLERIDAHGKHLLYRFAGLDEALHVHLGLFGLFVTRVKPADEPRPTCRLELEGDTRVVRLSGAIACELLDPAAEATLLGRLGPDPLRRDADPDRAWAALQRRRAPLAAALMDQRVLAGLGNMYRAEVLHACGLDPHRPARELEREDFDRLWLATADHLSDGLRTRRRLPRAVYQQRSCRACGGAVQREELDGRTLHWCPACQPPTTSTSTSTSGEVAKPTAP